MCLLEKVRIHSKEHFCGIHKLSLDTANPGKRLGYVRENYSFCVPVFSIFNENDNEVYRIEGNCCGVCNYTLHIFDKHSGNESKDSVGVIQKRWSGIGKELFTDADNFFIQVNII